MKNEKNLEKGVSYSQPLGQDKPRGENEKTGISTGNTGSSIKSDRGSFPVK